MTQCQDALAFIKYIFRNNILAGLDGNHLHLAVTALEEILRNQRAGILHALLRSTYTDGLGPIGTVDRPRAEPVVINAVVIVIAAVVIEHHDQRDAEVLLPEQGAMVHAVPAPVQVHVTV